MVVESFSKDLFLADKETLIVVTVFNRKPKVERFLDHLYKTDLSEAQVIIFDNGSKDGTKELLKERFDNEDKQTIVVSFPTNIGKSEAVNLVTISNPLPPNFKYIVSIDSDTYVNNKDWINIFKRELIRDEKIGFISCDFPPGTHGPHGGPQFYKKEGHLLNYHNMVCGRCFMSPIHVWKALKGYDKLGMYGGIDGMYTQRVRKLGYKTCVIPSLQFVHDTSIESESERLYEQRKGEIQKKIRLGISKHGESALYHKEEITWK